MLCDDKFSNPVSSSLSISADKMGFFQYFSIVGLYQCQGSDIALAVQRENVLFFKVDADSESFQFSDRGKRVNGIPCKSRQGFCQDQIHKTILTVGNHLHKAVTI